MEKAEAIGLINGLIAEIDLVRNDRNRFESWQQTCRIVLARIFGDKSDQSRSLMAVDYRFYGISQLGDNRPHVQAFFNGLTKSSHLLQGFIRQVERFGVSSPESVSHDEGQRNLPKKSEAGVNILISWSKKQSRAMASAFHTWLPKVVPGFKPWMSSKDIDKGKQWFGELQGFLGEATSCIICVTSENVRSPWIYYETGAIASKIKESVLVCPYLVGIGTSMISDGPLTQWQCTEATKEDTLALIKSLNKALPQPHDEALLTGNFESRWPEFKQELDRILAMEAAALADFIESEADVLAGVKLSSEARVLLVKASQGNGRVLYVRLLAGTNIQVGTEVLNNPTDRRSIATWERAISDLAKCGFLQQTGKDGMIYELTLDGYNAADVLKK